ncbi:MAG: amidohydrolase family protein [Desulfopila sp.]
MLHPNMPSVNDQEERHVPAGLPPVIDAHVHVFPENIFSAVWQWFDRNGWCIRYRLTSSQILAFLLSHGVEHVIAFQYAHKPGIAHGLNSYMAEKCREHDSRVTGLATVYPGEENAVNLLQQAFASGLGGLKLHAHVQCFDMNSDELYSLYECCREHGKPVVMHVGREPKSTAYRCDPYEICSAEKLERVLRDFPDLRICVPHLGIDETSAYRQLIEKYENLWLDTTMALAEYLPLEDRIDLKRYRSDRIMYGSDFPNIPYAWDRELKILQRADIAADTLAKITCGNATGFFGITQLNA